jgi:hypothetical protein
MVSLLAAKAEVVFGLQLVTRHRAPRLAALLGLSIGALAAASAPSPERVARVVLLMAGTLAAVAASRLLSPGPALAAARMVVAAWWLVPLGRLAGVLCVVGPITLGTGLALASASPQGAPILGPTAVALAFAACVSSCTMALAPWWGASAAASVGFLGVWFGGVPPTAVAALFAGWVPLQRVVIWLWNVLPLPWRAARWLASGGWEDALVLGAWTLFGLSLVGIHLAGPHRTRRAES